jgi:hypothetical protein
MANVLNRTTGQYLRSVHDPDYRSAVDAHPNLDAVTGSVPKYWVITGLNTMRCLTP